MNRIDRRKREVRDRILEAAFDLFEFVKLEQTAFCVLTDSGTVQEECCIFRVPAVTLRDSIERPEALDTGSIIMTGLDPAGVVAALPVLLKHQSDIELATRELGQVSS